MADGYLSLDVDREPSPPRALAKHKSKSRARPTSASGDARHLRSSAADKDAQRRHKALERHFDRARQASLASVFPVDPPLMSHGQSSATSLTSASQLLPASPSRPLVSNDPQGISGTLSKRTSVSLPDVSSVGLGGPVHPPPSRPEATFTPTAAGLRDPNGQLLATQIDLQSLLSNALSSLLAAGIRQSSLQQGPIVPSDIPPSSVPTRTKSPSRLAPVSSDESDGGDEPKEDLELSEDEGLAPDVPAFTGLFRPSLFKSLLHKARQTTNMTESASTSSDATSSTAPHEALFSSSKQGKDFIPCPQLFSEVLQSPWSQPGSLMGPNALDKKLYCAAPELDALLSLPVVDHPIANLSSSSLVSTDSLDALKSEDRKSELSFRKEHQALAWAIKTATATSFFNQATLLWLRQLQDKLPPEDARLHQDLNKIVAATEYSADASLN